MAKDWREEWEERMAAALVEDAADPSLRAWAVANGWVEHADPWSTLSPKSWRMTTRNTIWPLDRALAEWRRQRANQESGEVCAKCGHPDFETSYTDKEDQARFPRFCFRCRHWAGYAMQRDDPRNARIDGQHFRIAPDLPAGRDSWHAGHGGAHFRIRFADGRVVDSRNLWCQGEIPDAWRAELPDNAQFVPSASAVAS